MYRNPHAGDRDRRTRRPCGRRLQDFDREADLQAFYELGYADDYQLRPHELAEAQARHGMDWPELP
jgi:hypothetical protein